MVINITQLFYQKKPIPFNPAYMIDNAGIVYKPDGSVLHQFNSSGYKQVCICPVDGSRRRVFGVHQLVAMTFDPNYTPDCNVHHLDENKTNNKAYNLECMPKSEHARLHADITHISNYLKENGPYNKGMKMSDEFREKCRQSALKREEKKRKTQLLGEHDN